MKQRKSILEELFNGEFFPAENIVPSDPDYRPLSNEVGKVIAYLSDRMSSDDKERFELLQDDIAYVHDLELRAFFTEGLRFGVQFLLELLYGPQNNRSPRT